MRPGSPYAAEGGKTGIQVMVVDCSGNNEA